MTETATIRRALSAIQATLNAPKNQYNKGKHVPEYILEYIANHFSYNPESGMITRDDRRNSAGSFDKDGYLILKIKGNQFKAHRVAWFLHYGVFPEMEIDHINRNRSDNRICNLRDATRTCNIRNMAKTANPETGVIGVYLDKTTKGLKKKFTTRIQGKTYRFYSVQDAIDFRKLLII